MRVVVRAEQHRPREHEQVRGVELLVIAVHRSEIVGSSEMAATLAPTVSPLRNAIGRICQQKIDRSERRHDLAAVAVVDSDRVVLVVGLHDSRNICSGRGIGTVTRRPPAHAPRTLALTSSSYTSAYTPRERCPRYSRNAPSPFSSTPTSSVRVPSINPAMLTRRPSGDRRRRATRPRTGACGSSGASRATDAAPSRPPGATRRTPRG